MNPMLKPNLFPYTLEHNPDHVKQLFQRGVYKVLPEEFKKFYIEWKHQLPKPVHYIPKTGKYEKDPETGEIKPVQNFTLPLKDVPQMDDGIWGGESIVQGYVRTYHKRIKIDLGPAPRFWIPNLHKGVVYSEVLNKHMSCILTYRAINLINEHFGLDHYLLKTPACDLRNLLALQLKRKILMALRDKTLYPDDEQKREEIYELYKHYLDNFTHEEIEWYGLTLTEAVKKYINNLNASKTEPQPKKHLYRQEFLTFLREKAVEPEPVKEPWWKRPLLTYN